MKITFHRAFDLTSDPFLALEEIIASGAHTILTSGHRQTAEDGLEMIRELVKRGGDRITVMAGSGVNKMNVLLLREAGVRAYHFTANMRSESEMKYRNEALTSLGGIAPAGAYDSSLFDKEKFEGVVSILNETKL
jgi:copper homeostasis protein